MFSVKSQTSYWDLMVGMFFSQWAFPNVLLWALLLGFNFYTSVLPLLLAGKFMYGAALMMIYILRLILVMVFVLGFFIVAGGVSGSLKTHFMLQEYTFDGTTIINRADGLEQRGDLKNILNMYEDKKRFTLFKAGFKTEVISKKLLTGEEISLVRGFFKPKTSPIYHVAFLVFPWAVLVMALATGWLVFRPVYSMVTYSETMKAYWISDEAVVGIPTHAMGYRNSFLSEISHRFSGRPVCYQPYYEMQLFDIKNGRVTETTLTDHKPLVLRTKGGNLYCHGSTWDKVPVAWKLSGGKFVSVTDAAELKGLIDDWLHLDTPWKHFALWDETDQELESDNLDSFDRADDWATLSLQPKPLKIHCLKKSAGRPGHAIKTYTATGMDAAGTEKFLAEIEDSEKTVSKEVFDRYFIPEPTEEHVVEVKP